MPLDAVFLRALTAELAQELEGARIDKIQQPERDLLLLSVRTGSANRKLLLAAGSGNARVHFTTMNLENPAEPPMFCMLLRKHLTGARIRSVTQPKNERMLVFSLDVRNEMGDSAERSLIVEMIGRSANVILVGQDGIIIDCLRRMDFAGDALRALQPGRIYRLPPAQNKLDLFELGADELRSLLEGADRSAPPDRYLLSQFAGLSPLICRELSFRSGEAYDRLPPQLEAFRETVEAGDTAPWLLVEEGRARDFSFLPIRQYGLSLENRRMESFSALLDAVYAERDREESRRRHSRELLHSVRTLRDRLDRKLAVQREELARTAGRDELRKTAELITANLFRIRRGDRSLVCEDYYQPDCPEITIPLDPLKSPQQNAAALFKEYARLRAAEEHLRVLIGQGEAQLDYVESVLDQIERSESDGDLAELRRELEEAGLLRRQKQGRREKLRPTQPLRYRSDDGTEILVGRNNLQNDELTTKLGRRTDYWLHTQKVHGSHVLIRCEGAEPSELTLRQAASLAVFHSRARDGGKTPVDAAMLRNVRKPAGALPGKVIYTDYRTLTAQADPALAERLRQKK
ncbi:MAG: NFACT family protein [Oscillospiraceae bacterium]|nr:NFACT family protein [Oscillospiraceae bacterium]